MILVQMIQNRSCQLEAGFIAEQYQKLNGFLTECYGESNAKDGLIHFQVKWDLKTKIEDEKEMHP